MHGCYSYVLYRVVYVDVRCKENTMLYLCTLTEKVIVGCTFGFILGVDVRKCKFEGISGRDGETVNRAAE